MPNCHIRKTSNPGLTLRTGRQGQGRITPFSHPPQHLPQFTYLRVQLCVTDQRMDQRTNILWSNRASPQDEKRYAGNFDPYQRQKMVLPASQLIKSLFSPLEVYFFAQVQMRQKCYIHFILYYSRH